MKKLILKYQYGGNYQSAQNSSQSDSFANGVMQGLAQGGLYGMIALGVDGFANKFPTPNAELNSNNLMAALARDGISNMLISSGNPYAMAAGAAVKIIDKTGGFSDVSEGLGTGNDIGNAVMSFLIPGAAWFMPKTDDYKMSADMKVMSRGYSGSVEDAGTAQSNAGAKLWFGKKKADHMIEDAKNRDKAISNIKQNADADFLTMRSMTQNKAIGNLYALMGGYQLKYARVGKFGLRLERAKQLSIKFKEPSEIKESKEVYVMKDGGEFFAKVTEEFTPTTEEQNNAFFASLFVDKYQKGHKFKTGLVVNTEQCAEFSNQYLRDAGYRTTGNAWNLDHVNLLYSGYNTDNYPKEYNADAVKAYNFDASNRFLKEFDSKTLDTNQIYAVNMYYAGSPAQERAYREGRDKMTGTHTGFAIWNPDTNRWEVVHNIHGKLHVDPFTKIQGKDSGYKYGITGIFSLKKLNMFSKAADEGKKLLNRIFEEGGTLECFEPSIEAFKEGGLMNVIPEGSLHARLHHMENADNLTKKGIPVVDNEGNQLAEIEHSEIIFTKEVTEKLEELYKKFKSDEYTNKEKENFAIEAGKLLSKEIIENTDDRVGLINTNN